MNFVEEITGPENGGAFDAQTFLDFLDGSAERWWPNPSSNFSPWVFRGQGNANWKLLPSAARPDEKLGAEFKAVLRTVKDELPSKVNNWNTLQPSFQSACIRAFSASRCVRQFMELADDLGMEGTGENFNSLLSEHRFRSADHFGIPSMAFGWHDQGAGPMLSSVALAQHHGVPTFLLDWTKDSAAACFFAAERAETDLAVWALDSSWISDWTIYHLEDRLLNKRGGLLKFGRPSTMGNQFLRAQSGFFTALPYVDFRYVDEYPALEDHLQRLSSSLADLVEDPELNESEVGAFARARSGDVMLKKVTLRAAEVPRLRQLLFRKRVSKAHLMPTLDNVRETVMQQLQASG